MGLGIVLLAAVLAAPVFGDGFGRGRNSGSGWGNGYCTNQGSGSGQRGPAAGYGLAALNMTEEQSAKIKSLHETYYTETTPLRRELLTKRTELQALWVQTSPDKKAILAKQKEITTLRSKMSEKKTALRFEVRGVLTPEQQTTMDLMRSGRNMGFRDGFGSGNCEGNGPQADRGFHRGRSMGLY